MIKGIGTKRMALYLLISVCLFVFVASALASGMDMGHECTGEDCLICMAISLREELFTQLLPVAVIFALWALITKASAESSETYPLPVTDTPVCLKVKLSN